MTQHPTVFFYVQHLLGIGHLIRAGVLTRVMARRDQFSVPVDMASAPKTAAILHSALNKHRKADFGAKTDYIMVNPEP